MLVNPSRRENRLSWEMSDRGLTGGPVISAGIEVAWGVVVDGGEVAAGIAVGASRMDACVDVGGGGAAVRLQAEKTWLNSNRVKEIHGFRLIVCSSNQQSLDSYAKIGVDIGDAF